MASSRDRRALGLPALAKRPAEPTGMQIGSVEEWEQFLLPAVATNTKDESSLNRQLTEDKRKESGLTVFRILVCGLALALAGVQARPEGNVEVDGNGDVKMEVDRSNAQRLSSQHLDC